MTFLPSAISWLIGSLGAWAVQFFTRKMTVAVTSITTFVLLTAAFVVCIKQIILYVMALAVIPTWITAGVGMFLPFNFAAVLSSILSAQSCRWAFDKAREKIALLNSAT